MKIDVYNLKAEKINQVELSKDIFGVTPNQTLITQAIHVYNSNQRKSHSQAKTRGEVAGTTKKVWSQKGTGRARHGDSRAPIFVGGGSAHGPQGDRNYKLKLNKKMSQIALKSVFSQFAKDNLIISVDSLDKIGPKTKQADLLIKNLKKADKNLEKSKKISLITKSSDKNIKLSFSNLDHINLIFTESINPYDLLNSDFLIFSQNSLELINK